MTRLIESCQPVKSSGDHQVKDEEQVILGPNSLVLEFPDDLFPDAAQVKHSLVLCIGYRRVDTAQEKWAGDSNSLKRLANNSRLKAFDINRDVGKFTHEKWPTLQGRTAGISLVE